MTGYSLNTQYAKEGSSASAGRLYTGAFVGKFTRASEFTNDKGTKGIALEFKADSGEVGGFTLYTYNGKGEPLAGLKRLHALMTCMKLRSINPAPGEFEDYDTATRQRIKVRGTIFPELLDKPIGLVIQMEDYAKNGGGIGQRPTLFAPYEADTKKLALEILDNLPATRLQNIVATVKDRALRPGQSNSTTSSGPHDYGGNGMQGGFVPDDDDIPF